MNNLLTSLDNFKAYIQKDSVTDDDVVQDMIIASSNDIESYTYRLLRGRTYGANGLDAEYHNGDGEDKISLKQYPIISVTELYDDLSREFGSDTLKSILTSYQNTAIAGYKPTRLQNYFRLHLSQ